MNKNIQIIVAIIGIALIGWVIYTKRVSQKTNENLTASAINAVGLATTITTPNGGEVYKIGDALNITWNIGSHKIEIAIETSSRGTFITSGFVDTNINPIIGKYTWKIGDVYHIDSTGTKVLSKLPPGKYFVRLSDLETGYISRSGAPFILAN